MADASESDEKRARLSAALARAGAGDRSALETVYALTSAKLYGICLRILGDGAEAEDALQEVYVSVWRRAASFEPARASPISWLATLARNRAIDRLRAIRRRGPQAPVEMAQALADPAPDALTTLEKGEDSRRLGGCMGELDDQVSGAIRSAFFGGLTYKELAGASGVPLGTMKSVIRRGLMKLRECLER